MGLVHRGLPGAHAELSGAGRLRAEEPGGDVTIRSSDVSEMGAAARRHSCDRGHHHRQSGGHNRRFSLTRQAHPPWVSAAHGDLPYVRDPYGPDLPAPERQHAFDVRRHGARLPLRLPEGSTAYGISVTGARWSPRCLSFEFLRMRWNCRVVGSGCAAAAVRAGIRLPGRQHAEDPRRGPTSRS